MGQKDLQHGEYFDSNIRFADAYNGILFGGKSIIKTEELEECDSVLIQILENQKGEKVIADKIKRWRGQHLAIFSLENQNYVDYGMVIRVMKEEAMMYERQRKKALENYTIEGKKLAPGNEFLSGMKKEWKLLPVIPLVLYMGKNECWDGAVSLYELLDIDEDLKPYANNYKINLYDYHRESDFSKFKTENRILFELLYHNDNFEKVEQIFKEANEDYDLDKNASSTLLKLADIKIDMEDIKVNVNGRVKYDVCKAVEIMRQNARAEGKKEGIEQGREQGIEQGTVLVLHDLVVQGFISVELAADKASMSVDEFLTNVKKYMN